MNRTRLDDSDDSGRIDSGGSLASGGSTAPNTPPYDDNSDGDDDDGDDDEEEEKRKRGAVRCSGSGPISEGKERGKWRERIKLWASEDVALLFAEMNAAEECMRTVLSENYDGLSLLALCSGNLEESRDSIKKLLGVKGGPATSIVCEVWKLLKEEEEEEEGEAKKVARPVFG